MIHVSISIDKWLADISVALSGSYTQCTQAVLKIEI